MSGLAIPDDREVHLWIVSLAGASADQRSYALLTSAERDRADRFKVERARAQFVRSRGSLRSILAAYTGASPENVPLGADPNGKPILEGACSTSALRFNVSHSDELMLCGVASGRRIGVDVEHVRRDVAWSGIAARFFAAEECAAIAALPVETRRRAFFEIWTAKEAYLKATGVGLKQGLRSFAVALAPARLVRVDEASDEDGWMVRHVEPAADYVGAVVTEGRDCHVDPRVWPQP